MKYFCTIIISLLSLTYAIGQGRSLQAYVIKGELSHSEGKYIYFSCKGTGADRIWDSTIVNNNRFVFTGILKEPANGFITTLPFDRVKNLEDKNITRRLFISPAAMTIALEPGNFQQAVLKGSKYQDEYRSLQRSKQPFLDRIKTLSHLSDSLNEAYIKKTTDDKGESEKTRLAATMDSLNKLSDAVWAEAAKVDKNFFAKHPDSYITAYLLKDYYSGLTVKELEYYYNRMQPATKKWEYGLQLKEAIRALQQGSPGNMATDFREADINGDSLSLSQFKGKYVLLDFWASWCKPCRAGNPELIQLYKRYNSKGIEFIGLADDTSHEDKWRAAVEKDHINIWRQVLDNGIGDNYAVHSIPLQILIDPAGKIIARFGDGGEPHENISKTLKKIFGN